MRFINLASRFSKEWDEVVYDSDDAWLYHLYDWLQVTEKIWHLESKSFLVEHEGEIIGIFPLQMRYKDLRSIFMGTGGAALKNGLDLGFREKVLRAMYEHVEEIARENDSHQVDIYLPPLAWACLNNRWSVNPLINYFYSDSSTQTWIVDLTKPENVIFSNLSYDARRSIKKAREKGYRIREIRSLDGVDRYYEVHCETYHRTGVNPHPKEYFINIFRYICNKGYAAIWEASDLNGKPVAYEIIGLFKKGAVYWSGCCRTDHLSSGVNYLLQYSSMLWAKSCGAEWFENGEAFPNIVEGKLKGLTVFKGKFGGELHRFFKGSLVLDGESKKERPFIIWLRYTVLLLRSVLGERVINLAAGLLRKVYHFFARIYRFTKHCHTINFIKPYWGLKEFTCGFFYTDNKNKKQLNILIKEFGEKLGIEGAIIPTSSGRIALELALKVLKSKYPAKQKVIIPTYCCKGIYDPVINIGLTPVFVDIERSLNISKDSLRQQLKHLDGNVLAIVVPHIGGCKAEIEEIALIAKEEGVIIIEDVCQALGGRGPDSYWGTRYDMSIFSFGMGKNLMATAGGILVSNILKDDIYKEAKSLGKERTKLVKKRFKSILLKHFFKLNQNYSKYLPSAYEYNEMHSLDAILVSSQLRKLETITQKRRENAKAIINALNNTGFKISIQDDKNHVYTKLIVVFELREQHKKLRDSLNNNDIETESMYIPFHLRDFAFDFWDKGGLQCSERVYKNIFNIPVRPNLSRGQLRRIIKAIENADTRRD